MARAMRAVQIFAIVFGGFLAHFKGIESFIR
jgi:hypothetical protein